MPEAAATRSELIARLDELESIQSSEAVMTAFRDSLNQIESVLGGQVKDVAAATDKIDKVKESIDKFKDVVENAKGLLETRGLDGAIDGATRGSEAFGKISDGVGKLGSKSKEVAETISKLSDKLDKIAELQAMGGDQADKLISEFGNMISGITDLLGPLIDAVPVIGPFLDMYVQAIDGISKSVASIIASMRAHNLMARQAGIGDVYTFTVSGSTARRREIAEITAKLDQMGWDAPPAAPPQPTPEQLRVATDVTNAARNGLAAIDWGTGTSSPQAGWHQANRRLHQARQRLALAGQRASDVEWMGRDMDRLQREADAAKTELATATAAKHAADQPTVCDGFFEPGTIGPDGMVVLITAFDGRVAGEPWRYTYSAVFDSDGDAGNNFQASERFDWDQYQGTDRWWVLDYVDGIPNLGRFDGSFSVPTPTGARAVVADNAIIWFVPRVELGVDPSWRATSFRHDGSYDPAISGGDVTGANPTEPLLPIPVRDVTLTEQG